MKYILLMNKNIRIILLVFISLSQKKKKKDRKKEERKKDRQKERKKER